MKKAIILLISTVALFAACDRNDDSKGIYYFGAGYINMKQLSVTTLSPLSIL